MVTDIDKGTALVIKSALETDLPEFKFGLNQY